MVQDQLGASNSVTTTSQYLRKLNLDSSADTLSIAQALALVDNSADRTYSVVEDGDQVTLVTRRNLQACDKEILVTSDSSSALSNGFVNDLLDDVTSIIGTDATFCSESQLLAYVEVKQNIRCVFFRKCL